MYIDIRFIDDLYVDTKLIYDCQYYIEMCGVLPLFFYFPNIINLTFSKFIKW